MQTTIDIPAAHRRLKKIRLNMIRRCHCEHADTYADYGAKGVTVCQEWRDSSAAFIEWALTSGYAPGLKIDRRKSHLGYSPDNCRWATSREQALNRSGFNQHGFKGVSSRRDGHLWKARIAVGERVITKSGFRTAREAAKEYDRLAIQHHGEFACTNFPQEAVA